MFYVFVHMCTQECVFAWLRTSGPVLLCLITYNKKHLIKVALWPSETLSQNFDMDEEKLLFPSLSHRKAEKNCTAWLKKRGVHEAPEDADSDVPGYRKWGSITALCGNSSERRVKCRSNKWLEDLDPRSAIDATSSFWDDCLTFSKDTWRK